MDFRCTPWSPRLRPLLLALPLFVGACAAPPSQSDTSQPPQQQPPQITNVRDIGALMPSAAAATVASDGLIYPGELLAIDGQFLAEVTATIDGKALPCLQQTTTSLLLRVPVGLSPTAEHQLQLSNAKGRADYRFFSRHYLVGTDTDDNRIHFMRTDPAAKGYIDMATAYNVDLDQERPLFTQIAPSGGLLYAIGVDERTPLVTASGEFSYKVRVNVVELAAYDRPQLASENWIELHSQPTAVTLAGPGQMLILGATDLAVIDISDELKPTLSARIDLPRNSDSTLYTDLAVVDGGRTLALLELFANNLSLYTFDQPDQLQRLSQTPVAPAGSLPLAIDLEIDPADSQTLWVLTGPNLRLLGKAFVSQYETLFEDEGNASVDVTQKLSRYRISNNQFVSDKAIALPDHFVPFYVAAGGPNELYVSGFNGEFLDFDRLELNLSMIKNLIGGLFNSIQFGRILLINPDQGTITTHAKGLGLYYHLQYMPELGPVFALYKMGSSLLSPIPEAKWGMGVKSRGTFAIRDGDLRVILPPYSIGHISVQR